MVRRCAVGGEGDPEPDGVEVAASTPSGSELPWCQPLRLRHWDDRIRDWCGQIKIHLVLLVGAGGSGGVPGRRCGRGRRRWRGARQGRRAGPAGAGEAARHSRRRHAWARGGERDWGTGAKSLARVGVETQKCSLASLARARLLGAVHFAMEGQDRPCAYVHGYGHVHRICRRYLAHPNHPYEQQYT